MEKNDDILLLIKAQNGDNDAFTELFKRKAKELRLAAHIVLHNEPETKKVVTETFLQLLTRKPKFENDETLDSWLRSAVKRNAMQTSKNAVIS